MDADHYYFCGCPRPVASPERGHNHGADICEVKLTIWLVPQKPPPHDCTHCNDGKAATAVSFAGWRSISPVLNTFSHAADVRRENSPLLKSAGSLISQTFTELMQQGGSRGNGVVNTTMPGFIQTSPSHSKGGRNRLFFFHRIETFSPF